MADNRKEYEVEINGIKHTLLLSDDDAKAREAALPKGESLKQVTPRNKARSAANK